MIIVYWMLYLVLIKSTEQQSIIFNKQNYQMNKLMHLQRQSSGCISSFISNLCHSPTNQRQYTPHKPKKQHQKLKISELKKKFSSPYHACKAKTRAQSPKNKEIPTLPKKLQFQKVQMKLSKLKSPMTSKLLYGQNHFTYIRYTQNYRQFHSPQPKIITLQRHSSLLSIKSQYNVRSTSPSTSIKASIAQKSYIQILGQSKLELPLAQSYLEQKQRVKQFQQPEQYNEASNAKTRESFLQNSIISNKSLCKKPSRNFIQGPRLTVSIAGSNNEDLFNSKESLIMTRTMQKQQGSNFILKLV